jgi:hypothetical protein
MDFRFSEKSLALQEQMEEFFRAKILQGMAPRRRSSRT